MHDIITSIILGIVEGLSEFLPISSTGHLLVAEHLMGLGDEWEAFTVDLTTKRKTSLAGWLHKRLHASFALQDDENVLIASGEKEPSPVIVSLKTGGVTRNPSFKADLVRLASNPRYALLSDVGSPGVRVFDLEQNRELDPPNNLSIDN